MSKKLLARCLSRRVLAPALAGVVATLPAGGPAWGQTAYWSGAESSDWFNERNWVLGSVPDSGSDVVILHAPGMFPIANQPVIDGASVDIGRIDIVSTSDSVFHAGLTLTNVAELSSGRAEVITFTTGSGGTGGYSYVIVEGGSTWTVQGTSRELGDHSVQLLVGGVIGKSNRTAGWSLKASLSPWRRSMKLQAGRSSPMPAAAST